MAPLQHKGPRRRGGRRWLALAATLCPCMAFVPGARPLQSVAAPYFQTANPTHLWAGKANEVSPPAPPTTSGKFFTSPYVSPKASIDELLEYLGDHRTRHKATRQLLKRQTEVPASGLAELVKATCRVNNVQSCRQLLALMREAQSPADFELYDALLRLANLRDQWTLALSLLNDMERDGVRPTEAMLASTLHACIVANRPGEALSVLGRYQRHALQPSLAALGSFIRYLSDVQEVQGLRKVAAAIELLNVEGNAVLYTKLVSAFGRAGSYDDVLSTVALIEGRGMAEKGRVYSTAVSSLLEGNRTSEASELYHRAVGDGAAFSREGYEVVMRGAASSRDPGLSAFFLRELRTRLPEGESKGLEGKALWRPIQACARAGLLEEAAEIVSDYYLNVPDTGNDALQLRLLLRACAETAVVRENGNGNGNGSGSGNGGEGGWERHAAMDVGLKVYEAVEKRLGFVGDSYSCMVLIGAYRAREDYRAIIGLYENARLAGVSMWLPAISNVMFAYSKEGRTKEALDVFQSQTATLLSPGAKLPGSGGAREEGMWSRVLSRAMFLASELGRVDVATSILNLLTKSKHLRPGAKDYMNLIKAFSHGGSPAETLQVLVLMTKRKDPSPCTLHYNAVLHAFARQGRMDDALLVFADMKDRRVPPDAGTYNALVSGFERSRQPDKALEVYDEMKRLGIPVDKFVLSSLISVTADLRNRTRATGLLQSFQGMATGEGAMMPMNDVMYGSLMHALARDPRGRAGVPDMLHQARQEGIRPNTIMYNEALYAAYRQVRVDQGMAERALGLYREMLAEGLNPDSMTYRHLFKALRQACRFQELVDIAKTVDRELLVSSDRVGVPLITACFKVGDQDRALDLLSGLMLKENGTRYDTFRWATWVYCTKVTPPDVLAAESLVDMAASQGWKLDRSFYGSLMQGHWRAGGLERVFDIYANLPPAFLGGDRAAVACLGHHARGRLDRLSPLLKKMRELDDPPCQVLACELLKRLVGGGDWKIALETLELMVDFDLHVTREQARQIAAQAKASAEGGALEVLQGLTMLTVSDQKQDSSPQENDDDMRN